MNESVSVARGKVTKTGDYTEVEILNHEGFVFNRSEGASVWVPGEDCARVSLALLGGLTDEMVERVAKVLAIEFWTITEDEWDLLAPEDHENLRQRARVVLRAAFGVAAEGGE